MFNKTEYWKRRNAKEKKRGQDDSDTIKFYPKGTDVSRTKSDGTTVPVVNSIGKNLVQIRGKGFQNLSRSEFRRKTKNRLATASNYEYQHAKMGFSHDIKKPGQSLAYPPGLSNHIRHRQRQIERAQRHDTSVS
jgi:hypothetical protein